MSFDHIRSRAARPSALDIPETPDLEPHAPRDRRAPPTAMKETRVDALVLLGNGNVVYATGASWPLLDAGLSHVERPVAIVLADDDHPHLYMPFREGRDGNPSCPPTTCTARCTSNSTKA